MPLFDLMPALLFLMLNVFIPGPNVLNTIATAMGVWSGHGLRACGAFCMGACRAVCAAFAALPVAQAALTAFVGCCCSICLSAKIDRLTAIHNQPVARAFVQAFMVMMTNPKVLTTWLAVISLLPAMCCTSSCSP